MIDYFIIEKSFLYNSSYLKIQVDYQINRFIFEAKLDDNKIIWEINSEAPSLLSINNKEDFSYLIIEIPLNWIDWL